MAHHDTTSSEESGADVALVRVLVVDEDPIASRSYVRFFRSRGFDVGVAPDAKRALAMLDSDHYNVTLVHWHLPGEMDGLELARRVRASRPRTGIVMISGCSSSRDRAHALEQDVDDYLIKPAEPREMAARLRAVVRRLKPIGTVTWGPFRIDLVRNQVWVDRTEISALEPAHIRLLAYLAIRAGRICTYVELHEAIFKTAWRPDNRNCARAISALRACCGEAGKLIATVRGEGYALGIEGARQLPVTACDR